MAIPSTHPEKQQLRKEMRETLRTTEADDSPVLEAVRAWLRSQPALKAIATYAPLPGEIDLTPLVAEFPEIRWAFPRVEESHLVFHQVTDPENDLQPGAFNIREPKLALPVIDPFHLDAFLCPGLAFDEYGGRLGRGRGFYDRLLENARADALKIGVCRANQIVADTFAEPHDIAMDRVISG